MKEEFIAKFKEVYLKNGKKFGPTALQFGMEFHNFEKLLKRLGVDFRKITEPTNFSEFISKDETLKLLGETSWNLAKLKDELYERVKCQQIAY